MKLFFRGLGLIVLIIAFTGCARFFEHDSDIQARQALLDLMAIQDKFHKANKRYAKNLTEMSKYNLTYHSGIVYMEIEKAGKDAYRAISLPAESTTARVFAYDTGRGGFYEMDEIEVARYVLGALNFIRAEQRNHFLIDLSSYFLLTLTFIFGTRLWVKNRTPGSVPVLLMFFIGLAGLAWTVTVLHYLTADIVFEGMAKTLTYCALGAAGVCLLGSLFLFGKHSPGRASAVIVGLLATNVVIALISCAGLTNALLTYG